MNHTLLFLMVLLVISKMIRSISSVDKTRKDIVHDFRMESKELVTLAQIDSVDAIDSLEKIIADLEENIKKEGRGDIKVRGDIKAEQEELWVKPPYPDTLKMTLLHFENDKIQADLEQATRRLEKLKKKIRKFEKNKNNRKTSKS